VTTVTTTRTDDPGSSASCPSDPCSLRQAINYVGAGGTVNLRTPPTGKDVYTLTQGSINLNTGITINGVDPRSTVINAAAGAFLANTSMPIVVDNVTIDGTSAQLAHAFSASFSPSVTLANVSITGNQVVGMGPPANIPGLGGGLDVGGGSTVVLVHSSVTGNSAIPGSGPNGEGGGVFVGSGGTLTVVDSTIAGNSAAAGSAPGIGGGLYVLGGGMGPATVNLSSSTVAGNAATGTASSGGNIYLAADATVNVTNSIVAGGTATSAGTENCSGALHSLGHNVEDRNQCGLTGAGDQINTNPLLAPLADNGGNGVFTQALPFNSPAVDYGNPSGCTDALGAAVTTDQRGNARGTPCDVGAFEGTYPAAASAPPAISGTVAVGSALTCTPSFTGAAPIALTISWQRDGVSIASGPTYTVGAVDAGHKLSCSVVASNADGSATATSAAVAVPVPPTFTGVGPFAPSVTNPTQSHKRWRRGNHLATFTRKHKKPPVGTTFSFALNEQARVIFAFTQKVGGRKAKGRCVVQTHKNRKRPACKRTVTQGTLAFAGHPGANRAAFQGRISPSKKLKPGRYTLVISATNAAGQSSSPLTLSFIIVT
jgi:hypothetical protein